MARIKREPKAAAGVSIPKGRSQVQAGAKNTSGPTIRAQSKAAAPANKKRPAKPRKALNAKKKTAGGHAKLRYEAMWEGFDCQLSTCPK